MPAEMRRVPGAWPLTRNRTRTRRQSRSNAEVPESCRNTAARRSLRMVGRVAAGETVDLTFQLCTADPIKAGAHQRDSGDQTEDPATPDTRAGANGVDTGLRQRCRWINLPAGIIEPEVDLITVGDRAVRGDPLRPLVVQFAPAGAVRGTWPRCQDHRCAGVRLVWRVPGRRHHRIHHVAHPG